ncbi:MAG: insulinase family protein [Acidobacteria bacterium]|nr:insulinase family protein [Acidobacteriota bacterium]
MPAEYRIAIERFTLPNGLRVVLSPDHSTPVVTVYVVYDVGARAEERGRTGFAHLFEHMMFQGSKNAPKGVHFRVVESNGGALNGSTHPDFTDYFEVLPSHKLAVGLWLEADRMRGLQLNRANLDNQRDAVKQERRLAIDNRPYARAIVERWPELAFRNWQSSHSIIGSFEDLDAATVADVRRFFRTYYAPNNAVLALAGGLDAAQARKLIEDYFGDIPPHPQPPRPDLSEPAPVEPRADVFQDPLAQVPALVMGYPGPPRRSPDFYALAMLDIVLTAGESSRFYQRLVKGRKSVIQYEANLGWPFAGPADYKDPGLYGIFLLHKPDYRGGQIARQVEEEIREITSQGVPPRELNRARAFLRSGRVRQLQSSRSRAAALAQYEMLDGNPDYLNTELDVLLAVTGGQIQRAARQWLSPRRRTVLEIVPAKDPSRDRQGAVERSEP